MAVQIDAGTIAAAFEWLQSWLFTTVLTLRSAVQLGGIALALLFSILIVKPARIVVERIFAEGKRDISIRRAGQLASSIVQPTLWLVLVWASTSILATLERPVELLRLASNLLGVWIVIRVTSHLIRDPV